jgi:hypothetical protein
MHQLRLLEMLVGRPSVVLIDYDFRIGRSHFRGKGWRGLIALVMMLISRTAAIWTLVIPVKPVGILAFGLLYGLLGR